MKRRKLWCELLWWGAYIGIALPAMLSKTLGWWFVLAVMPGTFCLSLLKIMAKEDRE